MENINDIANWFLSKESMTHKKLQKLCYYAQAWYCALYDNGPLFEDEIEAWIHGPVIPTLYKKYSYSKWNKIHQVEFDEDTLNEDTLDVLDAVYNTYSSLSGDQLEALTHSEEPWQKARGSLKPLEPCNNTISLEDMREYYGKKYEESQND